MVWDLVHLLQQLLLMPHKVFYHQQKCGCKLHDKSGPSRHLQCRSLKVPLAMLCLEAVFHVPREWRRMEQALPHVLVRPLFCIRRKASNLRLFLDVFHSFIAQWVNQENKEYSAGASLWSTAEIMTLKLWPLFSLLVSPQTPASA